jgi:hypothetical protein
MSERKGDLSTLALYAYYLGRPPLDWAEKQVDVLIRVHQEVIAARAEDPGTFPGYCIELTTGALARRIIGELLDAGWTPPDAAELLRDYKPAELSKSQRRALTEASAVLCDLPDCGVAAVRQARAELGNHVGDFDLTIRAAEIARREAS